MIVNSSDGTGKLFVGLHNITNSENALLPWFKVPASKIGIDHLTFVKVRGVNRVRQGIQAHLDAPESLDPQGSVVREAKMGIQGSEVIKGLQEIQGR